MASYDRGHRVRRRAEGRAAEPAGHARARRAAGARRPARPDLVAQLAAAAVPRIEAVSFVSPKAVPQMAGAEEVVAAIERRDGVVVAGLALNEKGYDRLLGTGLDEVHFAFAATEQFNQRNQRASVD